ncbi:MAG: DUF370 domain-containing protein [Deltaproteobacteria bacterium]|jgi:regulator of extracellular matrix RemA (YlzA/DUF370 family)|nr:DUF370 domain-containing protein [Deltaproteobacteria bacterium]
MNETEAQPLLNIGFGSLVIAQRVVALLNPMAAPMRRLREDARDRGQLVDATHGRKTRCIVLMDSGHVILSSVQPETIRQRFAQEQRPQAAF